MPQRHKVNITLFRFITKLCGLTTFYVILFKFNPNGGVFHIIFSVSQNIVMDPNNITNNCKILISFVVIVVIVGPII